jgi:hypothetical protein
MFSYRTLFTTVLALASVTSQATTLAGWTFETSAPVTAGPVSAEIGSGSASGLHASASAVYSSPTGNGSAKSYNSTYWAVGDYYQFSTSTTGWMNVSLSWDQTSSATGPRDFKLAYSTNGSSFTDFATYQVPANSSPNAWSILTSTTVAHFAYDLSSITALNDQATVFFRLIDTSTTSANGTGTVGTAGTDRVDNFNINAVPLPAGAWLLASGLLGIGRLQRRKPLVR